MSRTGQMLGSYQIEAEIGQGGMATIYRAYQPRLERWVAIKMMAIDEAIDEPFLDKFRREARAVAALRHPNILTIYDYGEEDGMAYIVMEYVAGGALSDLLIGQPMLWSDAAPLIIPVGRALAYAHEQGIVHCDVKPANILLSEPHWPLLADFGLLKLRHGRDDDSNAGLMSGTPAYASPEQVTGAHVGQRSDIYSLGIILYELLTGKLPFRATSPKQMMMQRLLDAPLPPTMFNHHISPHFEAIILRTLARDPGERYPNMETLLAELSELPGTWMGEGHLPSLGSGTPGRTKSLSGHAVARGPHLIVTGTESVLILPVKNEVIIGRSDPGASQKPDVDLLPHGGIEAGVSRQHARIRYTVGGWLLEDLDSTNGTSLNVAPAQPGNSLRMSSGDVIRCGRLALVFYEE